MTARYRTNRTRLRPTRRGAAGAALLLAVVAAPVLVVSSMAAELGYRKAGGTPSFTIPQGLRQDGGGDAGKSDNPFSGLQYRKDAPKKKDVTKDMAPPPDTAGDAKADGKSPTAKTPTTETAQPAAKTATAPPPAANKTATKEPTRSQAQVEAETAGELAAEVAAETAQQQEVPPKTYNGCSSAKGHSDQQIAADHQSRIDWAEMQKVASEARLASADRAKALIHQSADINLDGMIYSKPTPGSLIALINSLAGIYNGGVAHVDGGGNDVGGTTTRRKKKEEPPVAGPQQPGVVINGGNEVPCCIPAPVPDPDPDPEDHELDAVDDLAATDYRKRVRGNVMGNDKHDGSGRVSLISRTKYGAMVLYRSGNWRYKNYPTFRDGGTDSFTYMLTDSSGETDVATVTIDVGAKPGKKKKKKKGGGGDRGGGRGGGGGGGGGGGFSPFSCRQTAERYSSLDPDVIAAKFGADQATQQAYTDAADDLLPGDRAHGKVDLALAEMQTAMASGAGEVELDLAQAKYKEAVGIQRNVVDATVQDPLRTFSKLVESSANSGGAIPVHPLLEPSDGAAAAQLMKQVLDPGVRGEIGKLGPMLSKYRPGDTLPPDLNTAVGRVYQRLAGADLGTQAAQTVVVQTKGATDTPETRSVAVPALGTPMLLPKDMDTARAFVSRVAGAMPLLSKLEDGVRAAAGKAPVQYLEQAAAQVLYSEVVGKERLLAAREITTADAGRTVGVSLDRGQAVKEVALTGDMGIREVKSLQPLDQQRMAFHDGRLTMARTLRADAEVAVAKSLYAGKQDKLATRVDLDQQNLVFATRDLAPKVQKAAMELPEMQKTLNAARMTALQELKAGNRIEGLEVGLKKLTAEVDGRRAVLDGAAAKSPVLYQALNRFDTSTEALQDETLRLGTDAGYAKVVERSGGTDVKGYTQELTQRIARTGAFGVGANSVLRGADGTITQQAMDNFTAFAGQAPALVKLPQEAPSADAGAPVPAATGNPAQSFTGQTGAVFKISEVEEKLRDGADLMVAGNAGGVYSKEVLDDPDRLEQILRDRVAGNGVVHRFNSDEEMRDIAQARLGGLGVARLRSEIEKPENFVKEFNQAVGGLGWAHEFESVDALQQFAQERVGGLGMVHKKSDLEDPEYVAKLMEERLGPFVTVHRFDSMEQMRDFVQSRLGGLGRAYTCLDLLDAGWSEDQVDSMFNRAREYGARDFETKAQWENRMMAEHEDDFVRDPNTGKVRFKTPDEIRREREVEMLASGDFIRDPRTGNLVRADSKAGAQVKRVILENKPKRVKIKLADGRDATLTIDGFTSLTDALADALRAQGYTQDAAGNWLDGQGNLVITGDSVRAYDDKYTAAMEEQYNGVSTLLTRRPPPPPPTPPTTADTLDDLADQIADSFGYTARNIELGGRLVDIQVRPGETFTEALARTLEGNGRFEFDAAGNLIDTKTGAVAWGADELIERDEKYRERVLAAVFGKGESGLNEDVLWLAKYGTPEQKQRAQQILDDLARRAEAVQKAEAAQRAVQDKLAALDADTTLTAREKRAQREALLAQLDQATQTRLDVEKGLIDQATTANESASRAQAASYTREERKVIDLTNDAKKIEDDIRALEAQKLAARTETQRKRLQQEIDKKLEQLYGLDQRIREARVEVENPARLEGRVPDLEIAADRFSGTTAADWRDAKARAVAVGYVTIGGEKRAVYLGPGGEPFRDPAGNLIDVPADVGKKYNDQIAARLAKEKDYYDRNKDKLAQALAAEQKTREEIAALEKKARDEGRELRGWEQTKLAGLQKKLAEQTGEVTEIATRIRERTQGYAALQQLVTGADGTVNADVKALIDMADAQAVKIQEDRAANQRAYDTGAATITYEIDGVKGEYKTEKARAYEREQAEKAKAAAEAAAARIAAEAAQAAYEMAKAAEQQMLREQAEARKKAEEFQRQMAAQSQALRGQFTRYEDELISAERRETSAAAELAAAQKDIELARAGRIPNTPELQKRYTDAQAALRKAQDEVAQKRMVSRQAQALAATNDPAVLARMNAQGKAIQTAAKAYESAQKLAAARYKALRDTQANPKATPDQIRRAREAYEAATRAEGTARQAVVDQQNMLGTMIDNALYTSTTPDYNKARLAQLEARAGDKGTQKGLTPEENEEYWRRRDIQQYFDKVDAAGDKLANIKRVREAYARDPKSVSIADQDNYLYASLTEEEMVILTGERQRQDLLRGLATAKDQGQAAIEASYIGEWMTSGRGGMGGKSLLHNDNVAQIRQELFGALDGRAAAQKDLADAQQLLTDRRAELAAAEAAFKKDPSDYTRRQVGFAQDLLYGAERRLRTAQDGVREAAADAKAVDQALSGNALLQDRQDRLTGAATLVAERQARLATALAASAVNPTSANLHQTQMAQEDLNRALEMLSGAQKGLAALATGNADPQGTGVRAPSYLDLLRADAKVKDDAARVQRQAEEQQYAAAREREYEALQALAKIKEAGGLDRTALEARRTAAQQELTRLQTQHQAAVAAGDKTKVADLERQIALQTRVEMGYDGAIRQQDADSRYASARLELARLRVAQAKAEEEGNSDEAKRLKKLVTQQQAVMTYQETYAANLRNQNIVDFNDAANTLVPREWEVSAQYKAQEEQYRFSRAVDIQRRLKQQDQQRAAAEGQIRTDIDTLDDQVTALQIARGDLWQKKRDGKIDAEEADEQLASLDGQIGIAQQKLSDARAALGYRSSLFDNGDRNLREEWDAFVAQNRKDGVGPTSEHAVNVLARDHGVNLDAIYLAPAEVLDRQRQGGSELVTLYQDQQVTGEKETWSDMFVSEFNPFREDSTIRQAASLPWLGKTLVANTVGLGKGLYGMVEGGVKLAVGTADATYESVGLLLGADIETDTLDSINNVLKVVNERGVGRIVHDIKEDFFRKLDKGDAVWNRGVAGGQIAAEVVAAALSGGSGALVKVATGLEKTAVALSRTARVLDKVSDLARIGGEVATTAARWSRASEYAADGLRVLAGRAISADSTLRAGARTLVGGLVNVADRPASLVARAVPEALQPGILPALRSSLAKASLHEVQNAQNMATALRRAENLLARAAKSNKTDEIATLVNEAMALKRTAQSFFDANPKAMDVLAEVGGLTNDVARLNPQRAAAALARRADLAEAGGDLAGSVALRRASIAAAGAAEAPDAATLALRKAAQESRDRRALAVLDDFVPDAATDPDAVAANLRRAFQGDGVADANLRRKADELAQSAALQRDTLAREADNLERALAGAPDEAREAGLRAVKAKRDQVADLDRVERVMRNLRDGADDAVPGGTQVARAAPDGGGAAGGAKKVDAEIPDADRPVVFDAPETPAGTAAVGTPDAKKTLNRPRGPPQVTEPVKAADLDSAARAAEANANLARRAADNVPGGKVSGDDLKAAREAYDDVLRKAKDNLATPAEVRAARQEYARLSTRDNYVKARKEAADDLALRQSILKKAAEDPDALQQLSKSDLDWLSGKRKDLTPDEEAWADELIRANGGDWFKVSKALNEGLSEIEMHKLVTYRKKVVDDMLDAAIREVEQETGHRLSRQAFGSTNLTSDYDLSVTGWGAEKVVGKFNAAFRKKFGREPGLFFDTNVYTDPVYNIFSRQALRKAGLDLPPTELDEFRQFLFDQMATRKYLNDQQWAQHVKILESTAPDEATRDLIRNAARQVDSAEAAARGRLDQRMQDIARRTGQDIGHKNVQLQAKNELYEEVLGSIDDFRNQHDFLSRLGPNRLDLEMPASSLTGEGTAYAEAVNKIRRLYAEGDIAGADALKAATLGGLENQMRNRQGTALYYASEAYQTQGTIAHVVGEIQAGGKPINFASLTVPKRKDVVPDPDAVNGYLNSFNENRANMFKELNELVGATGGYGDNAAKAAGK
ncbi:MAG: hypothetical protein H6906_02605, partial [Hyphomicrobiales bacterium]|nr:hypothetical protein [Hyphomicrobiales bacterium]